MEGVSEQLSDRVEDGFSEDEAVASLGNVEILAQQILNEAGESHRKMGVFNRCLLILGSPAWGPLMMVLFCVAVALYVVLWAVWVALAAAVVGNGASVKWLWCLPDDYKGILS